MLWAWISGNWSEALSGLGELVGVFSSVRRERERKANTLAELTESHRQLWDYVRSRPGSAGLFDRNRNLAVCPRTDDETHCVRLILLHFSRCLAEHRAGRYDLPENLAADVRACLAYPAVRDAWNELKVFQNRKNVLFVERALARKD
jgi:hypothetical protein